jgi:hypothetical protein
MNLPPKQEKAAQALFCFVEILPPSTLHPVKPDFYAMTFEIEVGHGNKSRLFMREDGELTDDPALAALVSKSFDRDAQGRAYHRKRAFMALPRQKTSSAPWASQKAFASTTTPHEIPLQTPVPEPDPQRHQAVSEREE